MIGSIQLATSQATQVSTQPTSTQRFFRRLRGGDEIAYTITVICAASILLVTCLLVYQLWVNSALSRHTSGWHFILSSEWNPVTDDYGAFPFAYGTVVTSFLALLIAVPSGLMAAVFLAELA